MILVLDPTAIVSALDAVSAQNWKRVQELPTHLRGAAYGACVVHGVLAARQLFGARGLSRRYALSAVQPNHAAEVIVGSKVEGQESKERVLEEVCILLTEVRWAVGA